MGGAIPDSNRTKSVTSLGAQATLQLPGNIIILQIDVNAVSYLDQFSCLCCYYRKNNFLIGTYTATNGNTGSQSMNHYITHGNVSLNANNILALDLFGSYGSTKSCNILKIQDGLITTFPSDTITNNTCNIKYIVIE